jgi:hypothetical protein
MIAGYGGSLGRRERPSSSESQAAPCEMVPGVCVSAGFPSILQHRVVRLCVGRQAGHHGEHIYQTGLQGLPDIFTRRVSIPYKSEYRPIPQALHAIEYDLFRGTLTPDMCSMFSGTQARAF